MKNSPPADNSVGLDNSKEMREKAAMKHPDKLGAGARKRDKLPPKERIGVAVKEYERGTLNSGSGHKVKSKAQALAIGYSESKNKQEKRDWQQNLNVGK